MRHNKLWVVLLLLGVMALVLAACAGGEEAPTVVVSDQPIIDGTVTVDRVIAVEAGWMVIHAEADGSFGPVIGQAPVEAGLNRGVVVEIDEAMATDTLYAMLHVDAGTAGVYEFPGDDGPVIHNDAPVSPPFAVTQ